MTDEAIAHEIADKLWPLEGDPTWAELREACSGWCRARDAALDGLQAQRDNGWRPRWVGLTADELGPYAGTGVGENAFAAGLTADIGLPDRDDEYRYPGY